MKKQILLSLSLTSVIFTLISCNNAKVKLTFDPNGGIVDTLTKEVAMGEKTTLPKPTKEGKTFLGWYTGYEESARLISENTEIKEDYNLCARWDSYDVKYYDNENNILIQKTIPDSGYIFDYGMNWDKTLNIMCHQDMEIKAILEDNSTIIKTTFPSYGIKNEDYVIPFEYNKALFESPTEEFLVKYSLMASLSTASEKNIKKFLTDSGFTNIESDGYEVKKACGYTFATLDLGTKKIVMVPIRGLKYGAEWANNFEFGLTGDHKGFSESATFIINELSNYLSTYDLSNTKLYITGYSRAGAIAGMMGKLLSNTISIPKENYSAYTFEAPASSTTTGEDNIYNYINEADLIVNLIPNEYNLKRPGKEISFYNPNSDKLMNQFDSSIRFRTFTKNANYQTDKDYPKYLIDSFIQYTQEKDDAPKDIKTREDFYNNYGESFEYILDKILGIDFDQVLSMLNDIKDNLGFIIANKDLLLPIITSYLESADVSYIADEFKAKLDTVLNFLNGPASKIKTELIFNNANLTRTIYMHIPITSYVLIMNYFK